VTLIVTFKTLFELRGTLDIDEIDLQRALSTPQGGRPTRSKESDTSATLRGAI
jgi:hypothetical protein